MGEVRGLLDAAQRPWCPENHSLFPPAFRAAVRAVLCVHNRRPELVGDVEVWLHVLSFAGRDWFANAEADVGALGSFSAPACHTSSVIRA